MRFLSLLWGMIALASACAQAQRSTHEITFRSGAFRVVGDLTLPAGNGPHPVILFVHGDGPNDRISGGTYIPIMERMHRVGYATFAWDKPGTGASTGRIDRSRLIEQRAQIVLDGIAALGQRPEIDAERVGLWGISQAGYVTPRVLTMTTDVAFVIAVSCPGEPGVEQGAYLVTAQARCAGQLSDEDAREMEHLLGAVEWADTYEEYVEHKRALAGYPAFLALEDQGVFVGVRPREQWHPPDLDGDYFANPMDVIERTSIPILAFFGARDTQADPIQGAQAYRAALDRAGNPHSRVVLLPDVDHNLIRSATGCITERNRRSRAQWQDYPPEYLDILEAWLRERRGGEATTR